MSSERTREWVVLWLERWGDRVRRGSGERCQIKRGEKCRKITRGQEWEPSVLKHAGWLLTVSQHESRNKIQGERGLVKQAISFMVYWGLEVKTLSLTKHNTNMKGRNNLSLNNRLTYSEL